jgi:hypothetical protein
MALVVLPAHPPGARQATKKALREGEVGLARPVVAVGHLTCGKGQSAYGRSTSWG